MTKPCFEDVALGGGEQETTHQMDETSKKHVVLKIVKNPKIFTSNSDSNGDGDIATTNLPI